MYTNNCESIIQFYYVIIVIHLNRNLKIDRNKMRCKKKIEK